MGFKYIHELIDEGLDEGDILERDCGLLEVKITEVSGDSRAKGTIVKDKRSITNLGKDVVIMTEDFKWNLKTEDKFVNYISRKDADEKCNCPSWELFTGYFSQLCPIHHKKFKRRFKV